MRFDSYDAVVIGGGFYGCVVARELRKYFERVLLLEKEHQLLERASYRNQARVHHGYHYPRSILTSLRSRLNFPRFIAEYADAVVSPSAQYYAIARTFSKVCASQFTLFCNRINAPLRPAPHDVKASFNPFHVEDVFSVVEYAFDAAKLRRMLQAQLADVGVEYATCASVDKLAPSPRTCRVIFDTDATTHQVETQYVFNCAYSLINGILSRSGLPLVPMKHEFAEMALIEVPESMRDMGITIMDGPFFATMPFPDRGLHTLHHVRYTPHHSWMDAPGAEYFDARRHFETFRPRSNYGHMIRDAVRYIPALAGTRFVESLWEVKTVLPRSEVDDSRPILFKPLDTFRNIVCVLGGKIDNVFDIQDYIRDFIGALR